MKILYMTIRYDITGKGLYQDFVNELNRKNHEVVIVRSSQETKLFSIDKKLKVLDVKTGNPFEKNKFKKGMNQILLNYYFKRAIRKKLKTEKFDLILYATPPITLCGVISYCKKEYKAKTFLMLKDIFPQNAVDLGMIKKNSFIYKYFRKKEKEYYEISDFIGCMSKGNIDYVKKNNPELSEKKIGLFPNSIIIKNIKQTIFNKNKTIFIFGGNLGIPQNIEGLLNIIEKMKDYPKAEFIIIGQGTEKEKVKQFYEQKKLKNFKFMSYLPQDEYEKVLQTADVGIISLDSRFTIPNIPSRFQAYLKLKKPTLAITDTNTDLKEMILDNNCGWWCNAIEQQTILGTIRKICENKEEQKQKGENGFKYLCKEFDVKDNVKKIEVFMKRR
ncbi:MAG: glycosyltransferase family 4 protein [Fusobacterium sp.]|nr:glycosyltransferase family 4 protein [Fusobacterium sp.]